MKTQRKKTIVLFYLVSLLIISLFIPILDAKPTGNGSFGGSVTVQSPILHETMLSSGVFGGSVVAQNPITEFFISSGSFGGSVAIGSGYVPGSCVTNSSGTFGGILQMTYYNWSEWSDSWYMGFAPTPFDEPSSFLSKHINVSTINLSWTKETNSNYTYIVRKKGSQPTSILDGTNVYNGTGIGYNDTNLNPGTHYFYSAWGFNESIDMFTVDYTYDDNYTSPGNPIYLYESSTTINSITLGWTKGTNATKTIVRYSTFAFPISPQSNLSAYNDTGSSVTISPLTSNTTFYFRAWSFNTTSGLFGDANTSVNSSTLEVTGTPTSFVATRVSDTKISLGWVKGTSSEKTRIQRKTGSYPTSISDGTNVYNGTGISYSDTGLTPATKYYYSAWGWDGTMFSLGYATANNITLPQKPQGFVGNLDGTTLTITWSKGTGAQRTVIRERNESYPISPTNGTAIYNGTGLYTTVYGITSFFYFRAWSFSVIDGISLFSESSELVYGGLTINVYNESKPSQKIWFNLLITNANGSETYSKTNAKSPCFISLNDVPIGEKTIIILSNSSYKQRTYYEDLSEYTIYNFSFYLPPLTTPGGGGGGSSTEENRTQLYLLTVYNRYDQTLQDVKINVKKYINTTGHYESVSIIYTDAAGQTNIYLVPFTLYQFTCSKEGFITGISYWTPTNLIQTHTFVLDFETNPTEPPKNPYSYITFSASFIDNTTLFIRVLDSSGNLSDATIYIYKNTTLDYTYNFTSSPLFLNFTGGNITLADYKVVLYIRSHPDFGSYNFSTIINKLSPQQGLLLNLDLQVGSILGNPGANVGVVISWLALLLLGLAMFVLLSFGRYWAGIGIASVGLVFGLFEVSFGITVTGALQIVSFVVYCIVLGALMELGKAKLGRGGIQ